MFILYREKMQKFNFGTPIDINIFIFTNLKIMRMKKLLILTLGLLPLFSFSQIDENELSFDVFKQDESFVNIGYGLGNFTQSIFKAGVNQDEVNLQYTGVGPLFAKYEYAFAEKIGIGVNIAYAQATADYLYKDQTTSDGSRLLEETLDWKSYSVLLRLNWHFGNNEKVDPYFGIGAGYRDAVWTATNNDPEQDFQSVEINNPLNFGMDLTFGSRFMFSENIGAYAEVGFAKAVLQFGLTAKF